MKNSLVTLTDVELLKYHSLYSSMVERNKRLDSTKRFSYDTKNGYHVVRLALEIEQILKEGDLDLERNSEVLKAVRAGEWTFERLEQWFADKERHLEDAYSTTKIPAYPDEGKIKHLLLTVLESHYGSLSEIVKKPSQEGQLLDELQSLVERYR